MADADVSGQEPEAAAAAAAGEVREEAAGPKEEELSGAADAVCQQADEQQADGGAAAPEQAAAAGEAAGEAEAVPAAPVEPTIRTQILVPVSSGYGGITPELLQRLFCIRGVKAQQLLLALVDSNGVVTRRWAVPPLSLLWHQGLLRWGRRMLQPLHMLLERPS